MLLDAVTCHILLYVEVKSWTFYLKVVRKYFLKTLQAYFTSNVPN